MALWLIGGIGLLVAGLIATRLFVTTSPARLIAIGRWTGVVVFGGLGVLLLFRERASVAFMLFGLAAVLAGWGPALRLGGAGRSSAGQRSDVETPWLRMSLDHETGATHGVVLQGPFAGRGLSDLSTEELASLLAVLQVEDADGAKLLEAYIVRVHGDAWNAGEGAAKGAPKSGPMSEADALDILGLQPGATDFDIREAHRRLMQRVHPDRGGSDYLAAKLNEARDLLLGKG